MAPSVHSDPMAPPSWARAPSARISAPARPPSPVQAYRLQQIIWNSDPRAVINGQLLRQGERLSGARVMHIDRHWVELKIGQKRQRLSLLTVTRKQSVD